MGECGEAEVDHVDDVVEGCVDFVMVIIPIGFKPEGEEVIDAIEVCGDVDGILDEGVIVVMMFHGEGDGGEDEEFIGVEG